MSRVFDNPNWYRAVNLAAGSDERKARRAALKSLRAQMRASAGPDWSANASARGEYEAQAGAAGYVVGKALTSALNQGVHPKTGAKLTKADKAARKAHYAARHELALHLDRIPGRTSGGAVKTWSETKAGAYNMGKKRKVVTQKWDGSAYKKARILLDVDTTRKFNSSRRARAKESSVAHEMYTDANGNERLRWTDGVKGSKGKSMGRLMAQFADIKALPYKERAAAIKAMAQFPDHDWVGAGPFGKRQSAKGGKASSSKQKAAGTLFGGPEKRATGQAAYNALSPAAKKAYSKAKAAGASKAELAAMRGARNNPGVFGALALDNYGGLALDNYGGFGGLALSNPLPFGVGVVAISTGKVIVTGLAGAALHAVVGSKIEEYLPNIPMGDKLLALEVPESIPVIGGMGLSNTVTGIIGGLAVILGSQYLGRKFAVHGLAEYGSAVGGGILIAGPILDYAAKGHSDKAGLSADDLAGLAIDNYGDLGALSEDQYSGVGVFGDGMAYELGPIVSDDEYGQASLGDAYYSGADFDVDEGDCIVRGRGRFQGKYGTAPQRIEQHGGRQEGSASHLAGRPGHRWGWLIKMIGWKNVEKLAKMPPAARVQAIKQLRDSAMATFKQISQQSQVQALASSEFAPAVSGLNTFGADGVHGASSSFGSTIFGGQGM
jgi:hypothetical protein